MTKLPMNQATDFLQIELAGAERKLNELKESKADKSRILYQRGIVDGLRSAVATISKSYEKAGS